MAIPERLINSSSFLEISEIPFVFSVTNTIIQAITRTTLVRIAVPRLDSTPVISDFAQNSSQAGKKG